LSGKSFPGENIESIGLDFSKLLSNAVNRKQGRFTQFFSNLAIFEIHSKLNSNEGDESGR